MSKLSRQIGTFIVLGALPSLASAALSYSHVGATGFTDDYLGRNQYDSTPNDVYGSTNYYNTEYIDTTLQNDGQIEVKVKTEFGGHQADTQYNYGDLFFDTSFDLYNNNWHDHRKYDDITRGNQWAYVVHIDDLTLGETSSTITNASATVYKIDYGIDDPRLHTTYRQPHEWRVDGNSSALTEIGNATWSTTWDNDVDDNVTFNFDLQDLQDIGIIPESGNFELAFHWTMSCGNDIIEGSLAYNVDDDSTPPPPVPEPATLGLLGLGLVGLIGVRRKQFTAD